MYRRRCEPDERVLLVRGGRFVKHTVRYIPLFLKSGENVPEAARSRRTRTFKYVEEGSRCIWCIIHTLTLQ